MDCPKCGNEFTAQDRTTMEDTLVGTYGQHNTLVLIIRHAWKCWGCDYYWRHADRSWSFTGLQIRKTEERDDDV